MALAIPALIGLYAGLLIATAPGSAGRQVSFTQFAQQLDAGHVRSVTLLSVDNRVLFVSGSRHDWASLPANQATEDRLLQTALARHVPLDVDQQSLKSIVLPATYLVPALLLGAVIVLMFLLMRPGQGGFLRARPRRGTASEGITFADVAGVDDAVVELQEVRAYLADPGRFANLGAKAPRGILLVGPPGTGKTLLARAVAGEAGAGFFSISGADFVELYVGVGASRVRDLFRQAREAAPAIVFIDEIDAVGRARSAMTTGGQEERDQTLNQLLVEMDGFDRGSGLVLIGATNRPDVLDPAILRKGRFDRQIVVEAPDRAGRVAILAVHARGKPLGPSVSLEALAAQTAGLTGADLAGVLNEAALLAGRGNRESIQEVDVDEALHRVVSGTARGGERLTEAERRLVAYHEAGHAAVSWALCPTAPATRISLVGRGHALGITTMTVEEDRSIATRGDLEARMAVLLGGVAAEELWYGEPSTGARDDLKRATRIATRMVRELGMSRAVGRMTLPDGLTVAPPASGNMAALVDTEVRRLVDEAFSGATVVLEGCAPVVEGLVNLVLARETLRADELAPFVAAVNQRQAATPRAGAAHPPLLGVVAGGGSPSGR
ncbi:MAG: ATP-dependent zinc metalloprotease FtsH [Acidimicrobiales bacterium]